MCASKRLLGPFETDPAQYLPQLPHQTSFFELLKSLVKFLRVETAYRLRRLRHVVQRHLFHAQFGVDDTVLLCPCGLVAEGGPIGNRGQLGQQARRR